MSYILDALRKAERDRNLGRTPSLGDVTAPVARPPSRRVSNRTLGLIALVVVLLICTVALWPRHPATPPSAPPVASNGAAPPAAPLPPVAAPVVPEPAAAPEAPAPAADATIAADVPAESIDDLMDDTEAPAEEAEATEGEASTPPAPRAAVAPESVPTVQASPSGPRNEAPAVAEEPTTTSDVPLLRDMPSDYRGAFPELRVDVHVYDDDPARRWVLINGHKALEGTTLAEGPTVSRITPEGVVFDFRGRTALFPLNR